MNNIFKDVMDSIGEKLCEAIVLLAGPSLIQNIDLTEVQLPFAIAATTAVDAETTEGTALSGDRAIRCAARDE